MTFYTAIKIRNMSNIIEVSWRKQLCDSVKLANNLHSSKVISAFVFKSFTFITELDEYVVIRRRYRVESKISSHNRESSYYS